MCMQITAGEAHRGNAICMQKITSTCDYDLCVSDIMETRDVYQNYFIICNVGFYLLVGQKNYTVLHIGGLPDLN